MGRFGERGEDADMNAALFHERFAAELGVKEAIVTLASIYLGLQHELLVNVYLEVNSCVDQVVSNFKMVYPLFLKQKAVPCKYVYLDLVCTW